MLSYKQWWAIQSLDRFMVTLTHNHVTLDYHEVDYVWASC